MSPGIILYLTDWYPSGRRARIVAWFMMAIAAAGLLGGLFSGWILQSFARVGGLAGWQWLFLRTGLIKGRRIGCDEEQRRERWPKDLAVEQEVIEPAEVQANPEAFRCIGEEVTETLATEVSPDPGYALVGAGAKVNYHPDKGNLLTASYPDFDHNKWKVASKDERVSDPCTITAYAIGLLSSH
jgi:hypothetical protein